MIRHSKHNTFFSVITAAACGGGQFAFAGSLALSLFFHLAAYSAFALLKTNGERAPQTVAVIEIDLSHIETASSPKALPAPIPASNPRAGANAASRSRAASIRTDRTSLEKTTPKNTEPPARDPEPGQEIAMETAKVNASGSLSGTEIPTLPANAKTAGTPSGIGGEGSSQNSGNGRQEKEALADYSRTIRALIDSHKEYPLAARKMGIRGAVVVSFSLDLHGELRGVALVKSSGNSLLDNAGLRAVQTVEKFPPPPRHAVQGNVISFRIPITFFLSAG